MKQYSIILLVLFAVNTISAQSKYIVYVVDGKSWIDSDKSQAQLKIGQQLKSGTLIRVDKEKKSSLLLICENYSVIKIDQDVVLGNSKTACPTLANFITKNYFRYIWDEMHHKEESPEEDRRKYMKGVGAVVRADLGVSINSAFDTINNYEGDVLLHWTPGDPSAKITFKIYPKKLGTTTLMDIPITDTFINLSSIKKNTNGADKLYWDISVNGRETGRRRFIKFWNKENFDTYIDSIKKEVSFDIDSAEWNFMMGFLLEADHFYGEALNYYRRAAELNKEQKLYLKTLNDFELMFGKGNAK